jgi:Fe-S cluster biosynthesis and repair protein YggX
MSQLSDRIAQYRKMATDDPDYELGHFRLGQLLMEDKQFAEAVKSLQRTIEISPQFSKAYQLLGNCLVQQGRKDEAVQTLTKGFHVADERGDNVPREEMEKMLRALGAPVPESKKAAAQVGGHGIGTGFHCQRPGCMVGSQAHQLPKPPMSDEMGQRIYQQICAECWNTWLRNISIKYINEGRLDLSRDDHQAYYDQLMKEYLGFE